MALNIMEAFTTSPPPLDFVWGGFLAGTVGALVAPGATGKSFWALEAAMAVAGAGVPGTDLLGLAPERAGRVLYYAAEDPVPVLQHRLHAIGAHLPQDARAAIAERLQLEPVMGARCNVMGEFLEELVRNASGARLVVLDTLSRLHALDENSNGEMAHLVTTLEYVAAETGAAVLYLHHVNKSSAREGSTDQQAARGASALIDNARWCGFIQRMSQKESETLSEGAEAIGEERRSFFARVGVSKQNYGRPSVDVWCERHEGGVLLPAVLSSTPGQKGGGRRDEA